MTAAPTLDRTTVKPADRADLVKEAVEQAFLDTDHQGVPPRQVEALASATKEVLLRGPGYDERARQALSQGGFRDDELEEVFREIEQAAA